MVVKTVSWRPSQVRLDGAQIDTDYLGLGVKIGCSKYQSNFVILIMQAYQSQPPRCRSLCPRREPFESACPCLPDM